MLSWEGVYTLLSLISTLDLPGAEKATRPSTLGTYPKIHHHFGTLAPGEAGRGPIRGRVVRQVSGGAPALSGAQLCCPLQEAQILVSPSGPSSFSAAQPHSPSLGCAALSLLRACCQVTEGPAWLCPCWSLLPPGPLLRAELQHGPVPSLIHGRSREGGSGAPTLRDLRILEGDWPGGDFI